MDQMWSFKTKHFILVISHDTIGKTITHGVTEKTPKQAKRISARIYPGSAQQGQNSALHKQSKES